MTEPHWTDRYYGELYLDSIEDLLTPALSAFEAELIASLLELDGSEVALDLACGHGRHARLLAPRVRRLVGVDRSEPYLRRASGGAHYVQGDVRALPIASNALDAAWSWYSSLFMYDDAQNEACLAEAARVLRAGGRLIVHHANPLRLAKTPFDSASRALPDGSRVEERSAFDPARGVDRCMRRLVRVGGEVLEGTAELRYYAPAEWPRLARAAGLELVRIASSTNPAAFAPDAPDLIAVLRKAS